MQKISDNLEKLQEANEETKHVSRTSSMKDVKKRIDKEMDEVGNVARVIKMKLEEIDLDNLENQKNPGCEKGTAVDRSRTTLTASLKKKLRVKVDDFQRLRQIIQEEYREIVQRRFFTATGINPTEEMIDELIESGNSEKIFQKAFHEMRRVQIFMDMAVLVESQGEMLDNIEIQVANAVNHVQNGTEALHTAKILQKKSRKCMIVAIVFLLIVAIVIVLSIMRTWI
ncbi:hypothetical protein HPP92_017048 [Vanilla planifolia]|uniref:t-SNARE coiled-coil homology domain-containing protein n=1 Tax=Vanilla planifolia TaxID=51239 RepID=A0A835QPD9_VANPL|nr:hypothetical protein HPP92_017048 [Vanilla planifolia]